MSEAERIDALRGQVPHVDSTIDDIHFSVVGLSPTPVLNTRTLYLASELGKGEIGEQLRKWGASAAYKPNDEVKKCPALFMQPKELRTSMRSVGGVTTLVTRVQGVRCGRCRF
jgi:hypothetical protein